MRWAANHLAVPSIVDQGSEGGAEWLITEALRGRDAGHPSWAAAPERLVRALARGLRSFHGAPVAACPFDFRLDVALGHVRVRLARNRIDARRDFHEEFAHLSEDDAVRRLVRDRPAVEDLVVCHGDYCLPNVLIESGVATGFVDLGELGVADRWWDLAVATWSLTWNLGAGFEDRFLSEYGVERDERRLQYYRLLYDVVS